MFGIKVDWRTVENEFSDTLGVLMGKFEGEGSTKRNSQQICFGYFLMIHEVADKDSKSVIGIKTIRFIGETKTREIRGKNMKLGSQNFDGGIINLRS